MHAFFKVFILCVPVQCDSVQAIGGTGALRIGMDFLRSRLGFETIYVSSPTWGKSTSAITFISAGRGRRGKTTHGSMVTHHTCCYGEGSTLGNYYLRRTHSP